MELTDAEKEVARRSKFDAISLLHERTGCGYKKAVLLINDFMYGAICPNCNGTGRIHKESEENEIKKDS